MLVRTNHCNGPVLPVPTEDVGNLDYLGIVFCEASRPIVRSRAEILMVNRNLVCHAGTLAF